MTPEDLAREYESRAQGLEMDAKLLLYNGHYASAAEQNIIARTLRGCAEEVRELSVSPGGCVPRTDFVCGPLGRRKLSSDESEWEQWCERVRTVLYDELTARGGDGLGVAVSVCRALKAAGRPR